MIFCVVSNFWGRGVMQTMIGIRCQSCLISFAYEPLLQRNSMRLKNNSNVAIKNYSDPCKPCTGRVVLRTDMLLCGVFNKHIIEALKLF